MRPPSRLNIHKSFDLRLAILGLVALLFSGLLVWLEPSIDYGIFRIVNNLSDLLNVPFIVASFAGTMIFAGVTVVACLLRKSTIVALKFACAAVSAWVVALAIKSLEIRSRPFELLEKVNVRENMDAMAGFPSGHMAIATALGVIAFRYSKTTRPLIVITIALVAISRMYLGMHLPFDLVGGFGVGLIAGSLVNYFFEKPLKLP